VAGLPSEITNVAGVYPAWASIYFLALELSMDFIHIELSVDLSVLVPLERIDYEGG
jgi:hypothetical protein